MREVPRERKWICRKTGADWRDLGASARCAAENCVTCHCASSLIISTLRFLAQHYVLFHKVFFFPKWNCSICKLALF